MTLKLKNNIYKIEDSLIVMKKNVVQFSVLIGCFVALLVILHFMHFGGLTGRAVFDGYSGNGGGWLVVVLVAGIVYIFIASLFLERRILREDGRAKLRRKDLIELKL